MIDQCSGPVPDRIHQTGQDGILDALGIQRAVERPPQLLQDVREVFRSGSGNGHAAGIGTIKVRVGTDAAGHYILSTCVQLFLFRIFFLKFAGWASFFDAFVLDEKGLVVQDAVFRLPCDEGCIFDEHDQPKPNWLG